MKNYLLHLNCYTEESINQCRFALLKFLSVYNLLPPANISVIVYTGRPSAFEIFLPYFKEMLIPDSEQPNSESNQASLEKYSSLYTGNILLCHPHCYIKKPIDEAYQKIANGYFATYKTSDHQITQETAVQGFNPAVLNNMGNTTFFSVADYFVNYKSTKQVNKLLSVFFKRNEEESLPNLVKKVHQIDMEQVEKDLLQMENLSLFAKLRNIIFGKHSIVHRYEKKL